VRAGSLLQVPTLAVGAGERVELRDVLLLSDGGNITVGSPTVANALVVAEVVEHGKARKVTNFKFKAKVRYRRKRGHRQPYTALRVREIQVDGKVVSEHKQSERGASPTAPIGEQMATMTGAAAASAAVAAQAESSAAPAPVPAGRTARRRSEPSAEPEAASVEATTEETSGAEADEAQTSTEESTTPTGRRRRQTQE
jgi:large subunit ribosomal protein L21